MNDTGVTKILAINLQQALDRNRTYLGSRKKLAAAADVSANSIMYLLHPERRTPSRSGDSSPKLSVLERVAKALGIEAWQLIHPDFPTSPVTERERQLWKKIESDFAKLTQLQEENRCGDYLPRLPPQE